MHVRERSSTNSWLEAHRTRITVAFTVVAVASAVFLALSYTDLFPATFSIDLGPFYASLTVVFTSIALYSQCAKTKNKNTEEPPSTKKRVTTGPLDTFNTTFSDLSGNSEPPSPLADPVQPPPAKRPLSRSQTGAIRQRSRGNDKTIRRFPATLGGRSPTKTNWKHVVQNRFEGNPFAALAENDHSEPESDEG